MANVAWNPVDSWSDLELTNDNTTVRKTSTGSYHGIRGTVSHDTGLRYFEAFVPSRGEGSMGLSMPTASLNAPLGYGMAEGLGIYNDGTMFTASSSYGSSEGNFEDRKAGFLVNLDTRRVWVCVASGVWSHGGNPASGGEGIDISHLTGPIFPAFCGYYTDDSSTLYSNADTIAFGLPAGAMLWGDEGGTVPTPTRKAIRSLQWL